MTPEVSQALRFLSSPTAGYLPYEPLDGSPSPQRRFHAAAATHRTRVLRGGNRSGKTEALAWEVACWATGWHPFLDEIQAPARIWVVVLDYVFGIGVLWPKLKRYLPPERILSIAWHRRAGQEIPIQVVMTNGTIIDFKSADAGREKFQSEACDLIAVDEEIPAPIVSECQFRLLDRAGHMIVSATPIRGERWLQDLEAEPGTHVTRLDTTLNPHVDQESVAEKLAGTPERFRALRARGDFVSLEGLVYPEFSRDVHLLRARRANATGGVLQNARGEAVAPWPLPPQWPRFMAVDFGFVHPFAAVWAAQDNRDRLFVYRLAYRSGIRFSQWPGIIRDLEGDEEIRERWGDHDANGRAEFEEAGDLFLSRAEKSVFSGCYQVASRLTIRKDGTPGIYFCLSDSRHRVIGDTGCRPLLDEIEGYRMVEDPKRGDRREERPVKRADDALDALRYLIMGVDFAAKPEWLEERRIPLPAW